MPRGVVQRLLQHAINVNAGAAFHRKRCTCLAVVYDDSVLPFHHGQIPVHGALQPASSSVTGCSACDRLRTLSSADCAISETSTRSARSGEPSGACLPARRSIEPMRRKNLPELVMQLARDVQQRGFLRCNQLLRQLAALL